LAFRLDYQGLSAGRRARDLGEFLARAKKIVDSETAPWGTTFDAHGWRSLAPITHSVSVEIYTPEGLFDFTSDPAIEALKLMKQITALSNPDILLKGVSDAGVNTTTDEATFAARCVGLYFTYFSASLLIAASDARSGRCLDTQGTRGARLDPDDEMRWLNLTHEQDCIMRRYEPVLR
jgi:hypothetical protein